MTCALECGNTPGGEYAERTFVLTCIRRQEIVRLLGANRRISDDMIADVTLQSADDLIDGVSSSEKALSIN